MAGKNFNLQWTNGKRKLAFKLWYYDLFFAVFGSFFVSAMYILFIIILFRTCSE